VVPAFAKSPWLGLAASTILGFLALRYRWQSSGLLKALEASSPRQAKELVDRLKFEKQDAERGLQKAKMAEKQAMIRVQALEKQQRTIEQERDNYRKLATEAAAGSGGGGGATVVGSGAIAAAVNSALSSPEVFKKRESDLVSFLHKLQNSTQRASREAVLAKCVRTESQRRSACTWRTAVRSFLAPSMKLTDLVSSSALVQLRLEQVRPGSAPGPVQREVSRERGTGRSVGAAVHGGNGPA
jgi:hypothetical protein